MNEDEAERMAQIGRAVVAWCMGDDPRANREATPERTTAYLQRMKDELHSLQTCKALRVGRLVLTLDGELREGSRG